MDPVWVSRIAAMIAALAAVTYACFTWKLILEMKEDRKLAYRPIIKAILIGDFCSCGNWISRMKDEFGNSPAKRDPGDNSRTNKMSA